MPKTSARSRSPGLGPGCLTTRINQRTLIRILVAANTHALSGKWATSCCPISRGFRALRSVLHDASAADHFQISDSPDVSGFRILCAIGENALAFLRSVSNGKTAIDLFECRWAPPRPFYQRCSDLQRTARPKSRRRSGGIDQACFFRPSGAASHQQLQFA